MTDETAKIARRLSGALGRKIEPTDIEFESDGLLLLADGSTYALLSKGNVAYRDGAWWSNGRKLTDAEAGQLRFS